MLDEINAALKSYFATWQELVGGRNIRVFFENLKPTAVAWKVADKTEYVRAVDALRPQAGRIYETKMNGRWIAKLILDDVELERGVCIIKIVQRRPDSDDALGLDHVDFYADDVPTLDAIMQDEPDLKATNESNSVIENYECISIWFEGAEAKIKSDTVLATVAKELRLIEEQILSK